MIQANGKIYCAHELEELILLESLYHPKQSIDLMQPLSKYRTVTSNPKISVYLQKTPNG